MLIKLIQRRRPSLNLKDNRDMVWRDWSHTFDRPLQYTSGQLCVWCHLMQRGKLAPDVAVGWCDMIPAVDMISSDSGQGLSRVWSHTCAHPQQLGVWCHYGERKGKLIVPPALAVTVGWYDMNRAGSVTWVVCQITDWPPNQYQTDVWLYVIYSALYADLIRWQHRSTAEKD